MIDTSVGKEPELKEEEIEINEDYESAEENSDQDGWDNWDASDEDNLEPEELVRKISIELSEIPIF